MRCAKCGVDNRERARFCSKCGVELFHRCASCGAEARTDERFCDSCSAALGADAAVAALAAKPNDARIRVTEKSAADNLGGERAAVTSLFADIKGSTELIEDLDTEEDPRLGFARPIFRALFSMDPEPEIVPTDPLPLPRRQSVVLHRRIGSFDLIG